MSGPDDDRPCSCEEAERLRAELAETRAKLEARDVCWHCLDCLEPELPHCERCPSECDDEGCAAEGCQSTRRETAA